MGSSSLIVGLVPLIVFAIADMFLGLKKALIAALIMAFVEAIWTYVTFGELDQITLLSLILIVLMGLLAWKKNSPIIFKLQPSLISFFLGAWMLISWLNQAPVLLEMAHKYGHLLPAENQAMLNSYAYELLLTRTTLSAGVALFMHAALTAWAAYRLSTWWWIAVRGVGFYIFCFAAMFAAQLSLNS